MVYFVVYAAHKIAWMCLVSPSRLVRWIEQTNTLRDSCLRYLDAGTLGNLNDFPLRSTTSPGNERTTPKRMIIAPLPSIDD